METETIEKVHEEFKDYFDQSRLIGSYSLFIPFYMVSLKVDYIYETKLSVIEQMICQCIAKDILETKDIAYVLGLPIETVAYTMNLLELNGYLEQSERLIVFTEQGKKLFTQNLKRQGELRTVDIYYDGLSPAYKIEFFGREKEHTFIKYNRIPHELKKNIIMPKTFPKYDKEADFLVLSQKMIQYLNEETQESDSSSTSKRVVTINDFALENKREVLYHEYRILVFQRTDGLSNLLAYDPCGEEFIDQRVTQSLQNLFKNDELNFGSEGQAEVPVDMQIIVDALKNYVASSDLRLSAKDKVESIKKLEEVEQRNEASRYIMNYEIRELFLHYLKNAKESLYIISPWMNSYIVNNTLIEDMTRLLERGVKISIIYGIYNTDEKMDDRDRKTNKLADKLKKLGEKYNGLLTVEHGQTHEKLLICDRQYYINGSFNFLSYSGAEDGKFFRNEGSTYSEDSILIEETIKLRFQEQKVE